MSTQGNGSGPNGGVVNELANTAVTSGVAVGSVMAVTMIPVVGTFIAIGGVAYLGYRAIKRGLNRSNR